MTYGWAIIIVIIVGLVMWRLGVFKPSAPKTSTGFDTFNVGTNFRIGSDGSATVIVINADRQGRTIVMNEANVSSGTCTGDSGAKGGGDNWTLACTGVPSGARGNPYTGVAVDISYTVEGLTYLESGTLTGKYE
ncbi:TPA: hypothetical protein H1005_02190 [archaeon]|nr:hypothetical protein [Candidatus Naiadarchaeales archaeon SRR2090153.bin1042]